MADFYGTVLEADAYHTARGNAAWGLLQQADKEAALTRASAVIDGRGPFSGKQSDPDEVLAWPRDGAVDSCTGHPATDGVTPRKIEYATYEVALLEAADPGSMSPAMDRATKSEQVDVLRVEYFGADTGEGAVSFPLAADRLLRCFVVAEPAMKWLERA